MEDPIANVGIKQSQKDAIIDLIVNISDYKSINEFVQAATVEKITRLKNNQISKNRTSKFHEIFDNINKINLELVSNELLGHHRLTNEIIHFIEMLKQSFQRFEYDYSYGDKMKNLLNARQIKEHLDNYIAHLVDRNQTARLGISENFLNELKKLRTEFVNLIAQEVKG